MSKLTNVPSRHTGAPRFAGGSGGVDTTVKTYNLSDEEKESYSKKTAEYYISLKEKGLTDKDAAENMGINVVKLNQLKNNWGFIGKKLDQMKTQLKQHKRKQGHKFDHRGSKEKAERGIENAKTEPESKEQEEKPKQSEDSNVNEFVEEVQKLKEENVSLSKQLEQSVSKNEYQRLEKERQELLGKLKTLRSEKELAGDSEEESNRISKLEQALKNAQEDLQQEKLKNEAKSEQIQEYEDQIVELQNSLLQESQKHFALSQYMILTLQEL